MSEQVENNKNNPLSPEHDQGDLSDMLSELRVLLPGAQILLAFLIILPFESGFSKINAVEKSVYVAAFLASMLSLILFAAPAVHHRLHRPLVNRQKYKDTVNKLIIGGIGSMSVALALIAHLVITHVFPGFQIGLYYAAVVLLIILAIWWIMPLRRPYD